jgi:hypothetical protein
MTELPKLAVHDAELVEADAALLYEEHRVSEGEEAVEWPAWADLADGHKAMFRFFARHPYVKLRG